MKPSLPKTTEAQSTKPPHRFAGGPVLGWIATKLRSALQILGNSWLGHLSKYDRSLATNENTTSPQTHALIHPSTRGNTISNSPLVEGDRAERKPEDVLHVTFQAESPLEKRPSPTPESAAEFAVPGRSVEPAAFKPQAVHSPSIAFRTRQQDSRSFVRLSQPEPTAPMNVLHPTVQQLGANAVTRDELKRELDTLRRLIESRK